MGDSSEQERKLLEILAQPEITSESGVEGREEAVETAFPNADEETKKLMVKAMSLDLPSPEEIAKQARIAQHNRVVQLRREDKLRRRKERRNIGSHSRKNHKGKS